VVPYGTTIELVGQAGTLYLDEVVQGTSIISVAKTAVDVTTWQTKWTLPTKYSWVAASPSGGAIVSLPYAPPFSQPSEQLTELDSAGQVIGVRGIYLKAPAQYNGTWIGSSSDWMVAKAGAFDDATRWDARPTIANQLTPTRFGSAQSDSRMQSPGMGVFAKTHHAAHDYSVLGIPAAWAVRFRHVSLRIVPHDQAYWFDRMGAAFSGLDTFGNWFFTLGAGMGDSDTSTACSGGLLKKGISRPNDLTVPPVDPLERLAFRESEETQVIDGLLNHYNAYGDDLPYNCFPEGDATFLIPPHPGTWNSNSFAAGLIEAAGLPLPRLPRAFFRLFPGFATAVPLPNFQ
jgi:hypothetical protein